jgi:class 3 adenylate cyclase
VLITEETRERLERDHGRWVARPAIPLRGKRATVRLYAPAEARETRAAA